MRRHASSRLHELRDPRNVERVEIEAIERLVEERRAANPVTFRRARGIPELAGGHARSRKREAAADEQHGVDHRLPMSVEDRRRNHSAVLTAVTQGLNDLASVAFEIAP